jgi:hypothetical protein
MPRPACCLATAAGCLPSPVDASRFLIAEQALCQASVAESLAGLIASWRQAQHAAAAEWQPAGAVVR